MDEAGIVKLCNSMQLLVSGAYPGSAKRGPHISISCPLAIKNHINKFDDNMSCSVQINEDGPSLVRCHSAACGFKGSLLSIVMYASQLRGDPPEMLKIIEGVSDCEKITLSGILGKVNRKLKIAGVKPGRDRDLLDESVLDPFKGSVPRYALERGLTVESCKRWGLGYDRELKRLVFPMRRRDGGLVGLSGRDITGESDRKYHNYAGLDRGKFIFGSHLLEEGKPIVLVEGQIDAVYTDQCLYPMCNVLATQGAGFSDAHISTIANNCPPYVCIFTDGDSAGSSMASRINYSLKSQHFVRKLMRTPFKKDPASLKENEVTALFNNAEIILDRIKW